jgi:hypothetical protein
MHVNRAIWIALTGIAMVSAALAARVVWLVLFEPASLMLGRW